VTKTVITLTLFLNACRATIPVSDTESVGTLQPSPSHVYHAPVHSSTDLTPTALIIEKSEPSANQSVKDDTLPGIQSKQSHGF